MTLRFNKIFCLLKLLFLPNLRIDFHPFTSEWYGALNLVEVCVSCYIRLHFLQMSSLQERLREKDEVIRQKGKQLYSAQNDRKRVDLELGELQDHRNIRERKVSVLQETVITANSWFTFTSLVRSPNNYSHPCSV